MIAARLLSDLCYAFASFSGTWTVLASALLFVRRRSILERGAWGERGFYLALGAVSLCIWQFNGLRPQPVILGDHVGLYWGIKTENVTWTLVGWWTKQVPPGGGSSIAVDYQKKVGWLVFHHYPTAPLRDRYRYVKLRANLGALPSESLRFVLYGDGKRAFPPGGLQPRPEHRCPLPAAQAAAGWICLQIPIATFGLHGRGIIGIGVGKGDTPDAGRLHLADVELIEATGSEGGHE